MERENLAKENENIKSIKKLTWTGQYWMKRRGRFSGTLTIKMIVTIELKSLTIRERMEKHMVHIKQKLEDKLSGNGTFGKILPNSYVIDDQLLLRNSCEIMGFPLHLSYEISPRKWTNQKSLFMSCEWL